MITPIMMPLTTKVLTSIIIIIITIMITIVIYCFFAENFDDNGSNRDDSNQSREMTTREVKAEVL